MSTSIKTYQQLTDEYADTIADEVRLLEDTLGGFEVAHPYNDEAQREMLERMAEAADEDADNYSPSVVDYLHGFCLGVMDLGERANEGDWIVTGRKILRSFDGPNCWITETGDNYVTVEVYWGGTSATRRVNAPAFMDALASLDN